MLNVAGLTEEITQTASVITSSIEETKVLTKIIDSIKTEIEFECSICIETYSKLKESKIRLTYHLQAMFNNNKDLFKNKNEKVICPVCGKVVNKKKCHDIFI